MGNYSLAVNSTFQPFTYQELAAPLDRQELYHEKLAEEYDKLSTQADVLEAMGQNDRDKRGGAYDRYKAYSDALRKEADDLYRHGLNVESRQRLSNLRRRYNTEIVPIQNAWTKRQEEADMQLKARLQNPELRFTRDAINTDLDEYIRNPQGGFNVVNLDKVYSDMYAASKNLAKQARERRIEGIDAYNDLLITPYGLDPNQVRDWMSNPNASPTLTNMLGAVLEKHGLTREEFLNTPNGRAILEEATNAAKNGAWGAVGEDRENILENFENRIKYKYNVEHPEDTTPPNAGLPGETIDINFNDPESAGNQMKRELAIATANYLQKSTNPNAKKMLDEWKDKGGIEAAIQHWETNGIDGNELKKNGLYYTLGNYIRSRVTKNEDIINIWRSDYSKGALTKGSTSTSVKGEYYPSVSVNPTPNAMVKNWGNMDKLSSNGYKVKAIDLYDDPEKLSKYLNHKFSRLGRSGFKLYEIKRIKGDGTYEYSAKKTDSKELPHVGNDPEKEIDYKRFHRAMLSNGDFLLYWLDDDNNTQERVLKRSDIGGNAVRDWEITSGGYKDALALYTKGKISKQRFDDYTKDLKERDLANAYLDTQGVNIEDYKVK